MLIASSRHTRADLQAWQEREAHDAALASARAPAIEANAARARRAIVEFASRPCYLGISWGKDSIVVAHLVAQLPDLPIRCVYFVHAPRDNPDCGAVRDAFLERYTMNYVEHLVDPRQPGDKTSKTARYRRWVNEAGLPHRRITGIRGAESRVRADSEHTHGVATEASCRPIISWSTADVFAYLYTHGLPVHPAYAQSMGGALDREWLRVAPLGGSEGTGHGRAEWERRYYGTRRGP